MFLARRKDFNWSFYSLKCFTHLKENLKSKLQLSTVDSFTFQPLANTNCFGSGQFTIISRSQNMYFFFFFKLCAKSKQQEEDMLSTFKTCCYQQKKFKLIS